MTRILLLHQPVDGGVGRHVRDLFDELSARGHDVVLAGPAIPHGTAQWRGAPDQDTAARDAHRRIDMVRAIHPRADLRALRAYLRLLDRERPDLVHAHSSKAGALARLGRLVRPRVPVLYTPHGYAFAGYFEQRWERGLYREVERVLAPLASIVVGVCAAEARLAQSIGRAGRVRMVHNGIDAAAESPGSSEPPGDHGPASPVLCTVGRLQAGKGIEVLIDAMPAVLARYPNTRLDLAGGGPQAGQLQDRARARGLGDRVQFLGELSDPRGVLSQAQIFVLPSLAESFPYVILEAMAAGLPVVASDVGGVPEAVVPGQSGLLVRPGDSGALSQAILALLDDPSLGHRLGAAARERVVRTFNRAGMIERLLSVYNEVLGRA